MITQEQRKTIETIIFRLHNSVVKQMQIQPIDINDELENYKKI